MDRITTKVAILVSSAVQGPTRTGRGRQGARRVPPIYKGEAYWGQRARVNVPVSVLNTNLKHSHIHVVVCILRINLTLVNC